MKNSYLRLVVTSVLVTWALIFAVLIGYVFTFTWSEEHARSDGVFLVFESIDVLPADERPAKLEALNAHLDVPFALASLVEVDEALGRPLKPGEYAYHWGNPSTQWYYLALSDGSGALVAGPRNPVVPRNVIPIGMLAAVIGLPLIAGFVALRLQRELAKVEDATVALARGELGARVDNSRGPSNELAASFNAMADRLERLVRSRHELVQSVSHELGSPLSRIRFHVEFLERAEPEAIAARIEAISGELDALDELVAELLRYVQSDDIELARTEFDPSAGLHDLAELARLDGRPHDELGFELRVEQVDRVFADRRLFQRAIENLLRNAVRYARERILVEVKAESHAVVVNV
ncbi:MAG: HAMP domain-containing sensor histidine kinase, partial [Myxococcota bacterium]